MHFMIQTFKIIIIAILFSNNFFITKQNETTTAKNNIHTMKKYDDDEYVDIKNKILNNYIEKNEFDEFKDYVVNNLDVLMALIISVLTVCICMLSLVTIMNCSRWENTSKYNKQCSRRNYLIFRDSCHGDINPNQPSYHLEHSCKDCGRWYCTYNFFNCYKPIPTSHQAERAQRAQHAQRAQRAQRVGRAEVHGEVAAELSVIYDGSNVSIQERHSNFQRSNSNPDHQPERAERAQRIECAQIHAEDEPSVICDGSNVPIKNQTAFMETDF